MAVLRFFLPGVLIPVGCLASQRATDVDANTGELSTSEADDIGCDQRLLLSFPATGST